MSVPIKTEPPPVRSQRLQGFKVPRDLSLGASPKDSSRGGSAAAANKKVFTPNLNVIRNKSTSSAKSADAPSPSNGRGQRGGRSERGGRGRGGQNAARGRGKTCIQSIGLFSEGIAQQPLRRQTQARPTYNESTVQRKPMLVKSTAKFDEGAEQQSLKDFLEDEDGGGRLDAMMIEDDFNIPVVLEEAKDVKKYPVSLADFFQRTTPQLFLIQLPDTLPGQGNELVSAKKSDDAPSTAEGDSEESGTQDHNNFCLMRGIQDGLIGKFIRYKSGKTKLVLGNTRFDVDLGLEPGFLQEVVSVRTNAHERNGDMINLGKINAKVNVSPDWEEMFQTMSSS